MQEINDNKEVQRLQKELPSMIDYANKLTIKTEDKVEEASAFISILNKRKKSIEAELNPIKQKAYEAYKSIGDFIKKIVDPIDEVIKIVKPKVAQYLHDENERREAEARKIAADNLALEQKAKKDADKLVAKGKLGQAQKVLQQADKKMEKEPEQIKPQNVVQRDYWTFEITDEKSVPEEYWIIDTVKLAEIARKTKGTLEIKGVRFFNKPSVSLH